MVFRHTGPPDNESGRICRECGARRPLEAFYKANRGTSRRRVCKGCVGAAARARRAVEPTRSREVSRAATLLRKYGLTEEDVFTLWREQGGYCGICPTRIFKDSLHIDHDHQTGVVRGLLCFNCNVALGHFRDDEARLRSALNYRSRLLEDA